MRLFSGVTTKITTLSIAFTAFFSSITYADLPDLSATRDERSLSNSSYVVGQHWFRKINGSDSVIDFPPAYDYLKNAVARILPQTSLYNKMVELTLLNSTQTNAFVIPGNHLFIYSDIMEMIDNEDMFYGLLAHEVSHLDLNHYERQTQHSGEELSKNLLLVGAGLAAALAGAAPDTSAALWMSGMANQVEGALSYSRHQEQEADRNGRQYLINAGLNPQGMTELFNALYKASSIRPDLEFLSSHPLPQSRIADSLSVTSQPSILRRKSQDDFYYFRATMIAYRASLEDQPFQYLQQIMPESEIESYAKALLYYLEHSPQKAIEQVKSLRTQNRFTDYLLALAYRANQNPQQSIATTKAVLDIAPRDIAFSTLYAELTHTKPTENSAPYLYENKLIWHAKMDYYQGIGNIPLALNYKAKLEFSKGRDDQAERLLKRAEKDMSNQDKTQIESTQNYFDSVKEAEKLEGIKDN